MFNMDFSNRGSIGNSKVMKYCSKRNRGSDVYFIVLSTISVFEQETRVVNLYS